MPINSRDDSIMLSNTLLSNEIHVNRHKLGNMITHISIYIFLGYEWVDICI